MSETCPHCMHSWDVHDGRYLDSRRCRDCGCLWRNPADIPEPTPPTEQDELVATIENVIWSALELQAEQGMGPYVDRDMGMVDASGAGLDMTAVAAAVAAIFVDKQGDCSWCHSTGAVGGWKLPLDTADPVETRDN